MGALLLSQLQAQICFIKKKKKLYLKGGFKY